MSDESKSHKAHGAAGGHAEVVVVPEPAAHAPAAAAPAPDPAAPARDLDEGHPGGRYLVGGREEGGKRVDAIMVDAEGKPIEGAGADKPKAAPKP